MSKIQGTGWGRGTQHTQSECNPVRLAYHHPHRSFAGSDFATTLSKLGELIARNRDEYAMIGQVFRCLD